MPNLISEGIATTTSPASFDETKAHAFVGKALGDVSAALTVILAYLGDRLGIFKDLAANGPASSAELARRAGINERYAQEWLGGMATARYLEYDPATGRFSLPPEHVAVLAQESGPVFFGGFYEQLPSLTKRVDHLLSAFRQGGGVSQAEYEPEFWEGMERFTNGWFENHLLQDWLPAMPDVDAKLRDGGMLADVGCGAGRALLKLAAAYPKARLTGFDISDRQLERAGANLKAAGISDRATVAKRDVVQGLPEQYDVITTFDVVHDAIDPAGLLRGIRQSLKPDGIYVCLDINSSSRLEENIGPLGALLHGASVLYCMTTSLAGGGAGLGTLGFHEEKVREMCSQAGFRTVRRVPLDSPFNILYEIRI